MILIQSQIHPNMIVTLGNLIHPLLHNVELLIEENLRYLWHDIMHVHHYEKLEPRLITPLLEHSNAHYRLQ